MEHHAVPATVQWMGSGLRPEQSQYPASVAGPCQVGSGADFGQPLS